MMRLEELIEAMQAVQAGADAVATAHELILRHQGERVASLGPQERRRRVLELWSCGRTTRQIAAATGFHETSVSRIIKSAKKAA